MASRDRTYRKALLKDSKLLLAAGILKGSRRAAEDSLRDLMKYRQVFLAGRPDVLEIAAGTTPEQLEFSVEAGRQVTPALTMLSPEALPLLLWTVEPDSEGRTARLFLTVSPADEAVLAADLQPDPAWCQQQAAFVHDLLAKSHYHRLEWTIPANQKLLQRLAERLGFVREGRLRGAVAADFFYQDAYLYGLLAPEDPVVRTAFVHFGWFLLELYGDDKLLKKVEIVPFGDLPTDHVSREALAYLHLLDAEGKLLKPQQPDFSTAGDILFAGPGRPFMLDRAGRELSAYIKGERVSFTTCLDPTVGTAFQRAVWTAIQTVPYGSVLTYEELAERLLSRRQDQSKSSPELYARAVGGACGANPFLLFVPCHRIVGKGGRLTGFRGGVENKARLLDFEIMKLRPPGDGKPELSS